MRLLLVLTLVLLVGCDMIRDQLDGNQPPVIDTFEAEPAEGETPLLVGFTWSIVDIENDALTCTLDFADGTTEEVENCGQVANQFHEYTAPGGYVVVLTVDDGVSSAAKSIAIRTIEAEGPNAPKTDAAYVAP